MSLPSQARPEGFLKKVMPLGGYGAGKAAQKPPVSEFESPKLKIALNSHLGSVEIAETAINAMKTTENLQICGGESFIFQLGREKHSLGKENRAKCFKPSTHY